MGIDPMKVDNLINMGPFNGRFTLTLRYYMAEVYRRI